MFVFKKILELTICNIALIYGFYQHMIPICRETLEPINNKDYFKVLMMTFRMGIPASYVWLIVFYSFFHCYMNLFAELTYFSDRRFYSDWWNAGSLSEYWRKWNFPIHSYLIRHVYYPLRRRDFSKPLALFATFLVSALAHEYVVVGIFRVFNGIAFTIMIFNVPIMIL